MKKIIATLAIIMIAALSLVMASPAQARPADRDDQDIVSMIAQDAWFDVSTGSQDAVCAYYYTHSSYSVYRQFRSAYAGMGISPYDIRWGLHRAFTRVC